MKKLLIVLLIIAYNVNAQQKFNFESMYSYALQGNVQRILQILDTLSNTSLTKEQQSLKEKYYKRFRSADETTDYKTKDSFLMDIISLYQVYWKNVLLKTHTIEQADSLFTEAIGSYLYHVFYTHTKTTKKELSDNFTDSLSSILKRKGYHCGTGKTGSLFDLLLWTKETTINYDVHLPERKINTAVVFMDGFISLGWEEYATFGRYYPGGWTISDASSIFCVKNAYDTTSENFKISYLQHESQHFADLKLYPNLSGADLEYRAKLVELGNTEVTFYKTLGFFIRNSNQEGRNPHAFGNFCVVRDLSKKLFGNDFENDMEKWKALSIKDIHKESIQLLKKNSIALRKAGKNVKELIK